MSGNRPHVKVGVVVTALIGFGIACYLVYAIGIGAVFSAASHIGWGGFALLCLLGLGLFCLLGLAWFNIIPARFGAKPTTLMWGRAVRDSAAEVLPFSQLGGFVIGARAVSLRGIDTSVAIASTIVDVTTEMMAQLAYVLTGIAILISRVPTTASSEWLARTAMAGTALAALGAVGFVLVQRHGFAVAERYTARMLPGAAAQAGQLHEALTEIHAAPLRLFASVCVHLAGWFASAFVAWAAVRLMGVHISYVSMISIEALLCAIRSAALIVPNALGVQEAAYAMLMPFFGIAAPVGLALSLLKRARDITLGIPVLLTWQAAESGRAFGIAGGSAKKVSGLSARIDRRRPIR